MDLNNYTMIYILGNVFLTFIIYKYMHVFYLHCKVKPIYELLFYTTYFALITCTHLLIRLPLAVMLANIVLLYLLALLYSKETKKSILSVTIIYFTLMCIETIIVFITGYFNLNLFIRSEYNSAFGIMVARILSYAFILAISGFKNLKDERSLPNIYWFSLIIIPFATIIILFTIFTGESISYSLILISMVSAFTINILMFYLYDQIANSISHKMNEKLTVERQKYYEHQIEMMKTTLDNTKMLRHDLKNKLSPLYDLAASGKTDEMAVLLADLINLCNWGKEYAASGNHNIDSLINYKLQEAEKKSIKISTNIIVPVELPIAIFDIADILGNLLDNALEAVCKIEDRRIDINVKYTKGRLIIEISNSYNGLTQKVGDNFISQKQDKENHGLGLKSIQNTIQKYDGSMKILHDEKIFTVKLLMYL